MFLISAPSKTFLLGEYAVLKGGAGLLLNTEPRFELRLRFRENAEPKCVGIKLESPAGQLLKDTRMLFDSFDVEFRDPHRGQGGFGASSAQFLMVFSFFFWAKQKLGAEGFILEPSEGAPFDRSTSLAIRERLEMISSQETFVVPKLELDKLLQVYLAYSWGGVGTAPSGLDVISQYLGGLVFVASPLLVANVGGKITPQVVFDKWPLPNCEVYILRTGEKIETHTHLSSLKHLEVEDLVSLTQSAITALTEHNESEFIWHVREFQLRLEQKELVASHTFQILSHIRMRPEVLACKGCGALGADVIMVLVMKELRSDFEDWIAENKKVLVAKSDDLCSGLEFEYRYQASEVGA